MSEKSKEFYELTPQEIEEAKAEPHLHKDKEELIRERISALRGSIEEVLRGQDIEEDPHIIALVAEDEELRERVVANFDIPMDQWTFNFFDLIQRKIAEIKARQ